MKEFLIASAFFGIMFFMSSLMTGRKTYDDSLYPIKKFYTEIFWVILVVGFVFGLMFLFFGTISLAFHVFLGCIAGGIAGGIFLHFLLTGWYYALKSRSSQSE